MLARNELFASILTICTDRHFDRKSVSSHHQQVKGKDYLPQPRKQFFCGLHVLGADSLQPAVKDLFTTQEKDRSGEQSRSAYLENFVLHPAIIETMGYPAGTDLGQADLHPRLDYWYGGRAKYQFPKTGGKSLKRERSSAALVDLALAHSSSSSSQTLSPPDSTPDRKVRRRGRSQAVAVASFSPVPSTPQLAWRRESSTNGIPRRSPSQPRSFPADTRSSLTLAPCTYSYTTPKIPVADLLNDTHFA